MGILELIVVLVTICGSFYMESNGIESGYTAYG